jgi:hypothetical protein
LAAKVVFDRDEVRAENGQVAIEILTFEGIGNNGLVLHANQVVETAPAQRQNGALELPGRGVGSRHGKVPGNIVF